MDLTRTFHPVGQGAFYSEVFKWDSDNSKDSEKRFVVVYDCGSYSLGSKSLDPQKNAKLKTKIHFDLGKSKSDKSDVDILFISHFDTDHINGCQFLDPKIVIIPYLSEEQINILSVINTVIDGDLQVDILRNPQNYFGNAIIIRIMPAGEEFNSNQGEGIIINLSDDNPGERFTANIELNSGQPIKVGDSTELWEYVPYNPDWNKFFLAFKTNIEEDKDLDYNELNKVDNGAYVSAHLQELRRIYNKMGNKNNHSLIVYSGPLCGTDCDSLFYTNCHYCYHYRHYIIHGYPFYRSACAYYGDITINSKWHDNYLAFLKNTNRTQHVGTIQIPHHGAWSSRGDKCINDKMGILCAISVGENNPYGHPSTRIISSILRKECNPVLITETPQSELIECFELHTQKDK